MFEKSLSDLVRGIRAHKDDESGYIAECIREIKKELRTDNMSNKANAVAKLTYLHMMGYDMSWAAFNIIEVMSSSKFVFKRIGYLAASQCFHEGIDVAMLATNLVKKDVLSTQVHESSIALSSLSCFLTQDLAMDLSNDIMALMISTKPIIRKKSTLAMYCIFMKFPDALRPAFPRLKEKLEDDDPGVKCAAVNVITELARHNPKNYLSMAPLFYNMIANSNNNWMLIKVIKLFGSLCPLEPRLGKKLLDPLTNLINTTSAMSLLYECVMTMIKGIPDHGSSVQLCISKLSLFIEDADQNLKYLGLLALGEIVKEHAKLIQPHRDMIVACLEDRDESIRRRALNLLGGMVSRKNIVEIVNRLRQHLGDNESVGYRDEIVLKILSICSNSGYTNVTNFEWYLTVLIELMRVEGIKDTGPIARQVLDVAIRVKDVRSFAVRQMSAILENTDALGNDTSEALYSVAYICGEFACYLEDPGKTLMACFKQPRLNVAPPHVQASLIHNSLKLYTRVLEVSPEGAAGDQLRSNSKTFLLENLESCIDSGELEVQERASTILQIVRYTAKVEGKGGSVLKELQALQEGELNPVAAVAQKKVPIPEGLDLDAWINSPPSDSEPEDAPWDQVLFGAEKGTVQPSYLPQVDSYQVTEEELTEKRKQRELSLASNPHYIKASIIPPDVQANSIGTSSVNEDLFKKPIQLSVPILIDSPAAAPAPVEKVKKHSRKGKSGKRSRRRRGDSSEEETIPAVHRVNIDVGEMPDGVRISDEDVESKSKSSNPHSKLDINLDAPLREDEFIPVRKHREVSSVPEKPPELLIEKPEKRRHHKKHHRRDKDRDGEREEGEGEDKKSKRRHRRREQEEPNLVDMREEIKPEPPVADPVVPPAPATATATAPGPDIGGDDLEFWLTGDAPTPSKPTEEASPENGAQIPDPEEESPHRKKHGKKHRREKDRDRERKRDKTATQLIERLDSETVPAPTKVSEPQNSLLELGFMAKKSSKRELAADKNLRILYEISQYNPMYPDQVLLSLTLCSLSSSLVSAMEINLIDSLSIQVVKPPGVGPRDGIVLPFQLRSGSDQDTQLAFTLHNVVVPQSLKGTLTYMVSSAQGSTSEKLDMRIHFPISSFIYSTNFSNEDLMQVLGSGGLGDAVTSQVPMKRATGFDNALSLISKGLHVSVIERVGTGASLYGASLKQHHVCLLVKDSLESGISVSVKSSDRTLTQSVADEVSKLV